MIYVAVRQERSEVAEVVGAWPRVEPDGAGGALRGLDRAKARCEAEHNRGRVVPSAVRWEEGFGEDEGGEPFLVARLGMWGWCYEVWACP